MHYRFGDFVLDTQRDELRRAGAVVRLDRQVWAVLAYLVQHHDRVVPRQELFEQLWPERFVSDAALERCITIARRAVGDSGRCQQVIQTVHGRGYRFVAIVEEGRDTPPGTVSLATPQPLGQPEASPAVSDIAAPLAASAPLLSTVLSPPLPFLPDGERRQVTVLYGTLTHTTALVERLGVAAFRHLVQTFHTLFQDCMQRYEGTVEPLGEAGVLALFGVPVAQEDHAWRAVQAALALQQRLREMASAGETRPGETLTASVGVHSGRVVVGGHTAEPPQSLLVGGDTTQGAMRLQALAEPGALVVSETTLRLLRAPVRSTASGLVRVPGHKDPLVVYTVQGLEAPQAPRVWSPFVGRQRELVALDDLLARALAGQGQVVGLIGEPGIGKSRLLVEFQERLQDRAVTVLEGYCRSYGRFLPYGPISDLLRQQCSLSATASLDMMATRVDQLLRTLGLSPEECAPYLLLLLGGSTSAGPLAQLAPDAIKARIFATLRQVHLRSSQQQPLLLVVENLHWIDPTSEAYLASLVGQLAGVPLLLLTTYRPGYQPLWMNKSYATQLTLPGLTDEESATVVRALLPPERHSETLVQRLLTRAEGNPLFLEELARAVQEHEGLPADISISETIQAVIAARMAQLPPAAKHLLHTAAVVGTEVPVALLAAIAEGSAEALEGSLAHLQAAEFLYATRLGPERVYTFKHVLTQEVAYETLLQERRCALHRRLVDVLEALVPDRLPEEIDRLAHHALRGEVWDKAVTYYRRAGFRAVERSALREAVAAFEQALVALQQLPDSRTTREQALDLHFDLHHALLPLGEFGRLLDHLRQAEPLAEALGDTRRLGLLANYRASCMANLGDPDGCLASAQRALALATTLEDGGLRVAATSTLGGVYWLLSDYRRAAEAFRQTVELMHDVPPRERFGTAAIQSVYARAHLARCLAELGDFVEGRGYGADALRLAETFAHPYSLAQVCAAVGLCYLRQGALLQAVQVFERGLAVSETAHLLPAIRMLNGRLGAAYALAGRVPEALPLLERALEQTLVMRQPINYAPFAIWLGEGYVLAGRLAEARQLGQRALEEARILKLQGHQAYALRLLGESAAHGEPPDVALAATYYHQALALAEELGMRPLQAHCHLGLGSLYATTGRRKQAGTALATAMALYRAMDMTFWLPQAEAALARVA